MYSRKRGLQHWDAEDVRQQVMMSLSRSLRGFRYDPARGTFRSYLGRVVRNAVFNHLARPARANATLDVDAVAARAADESKPEPGLSNDGGFDDLDELWEREWMNHHYRLAMATLRKSFNQKSVQIFDQLLAGEGMAEVAEAFDTTQQAVRKVKQRIRRRLQELIEEQIREEDEPY